MRAAIFRDELRELFRLSLPVAAAQAGTQLMGLVDVAVLGRLGARELAASGVGHAVFFAFSVVGIGIVLGIDPLVAQAVGAGDHLRARRALWQGVWLAIAVSAALMLVLVLGAQAMPLIGAPELTEDATAFLLVRTTSLFPLLLFFVMRSYLQAYGRTRPLLIAMIVANVLNLGGDIVLVFGGHDLPWWTGPLRLVPPLHVAGAALATTLCTIAEVAIVFVPLRAMGHALGVRERVDHRWNRRDVGQAFRIGLPIGLQMGAEVGIFALVALLAARVGTLQLAAHQVAISLASFTFTVALGVAAAGSVRVGRAIGRRDPVATRIAGHVAFLGGAIVMGTSAALFAFVPRAMARLVTDQESVLQAAIPLLLVVAVFQLSDGIQAVGAGVLRGAGDTKYTLYANLFGHWCIGLPVALFLGFKLHFGVVGLWWGLCVGLTVVAVILFLRFERLSRGEIEPIAHTTPMAH
ncbi:MAG: Multi antimicrobial extrusion protein [Acidobacteria bacterium]|nr:Multi antimicrobial extrusion protein [Acidobacteriota bacterium]